MSDRPILFLDVDGVLNCFGLQVDGEAFGSGAERVLCPHGTTERLRRLNEAFDVVWATAWFGRADPAFRSYLDLPEGRWPYVPWHQYKLTEIVKWAGERSWAWVDDDARWEMKALDWFAGRHFDGLVIQPDPSVGLTDEHVARLLAFAGTERVRGQVA